MKKNKIKAEKFVEVVTAIVCATAIVGGLLLSVISVLSGDFYALFGTVCAVLLIFLFTGLIAVINKMSLNIEKIKNKFYNEDE